MSPDTPQDPQQGKADDADGRGGGQGLEGRGRGRGRRAAGAASPSARGRRRPSPRPRARPPRRRPASDKAAAEASRGRRSREAAEEAAEAAAEDDEARGGRKARGRQGEGRRPGRSDRRGGQGGRAPRAPRKRDRRAPSRSGCHSSARRPSTCARPPARRGWCATTSAARTSSRRARSSRSRPRGAAKAWIKLLESAVANAEHNHELVGEELRIAAVHADEGPTLKRYRPRAMGRATRIRKRTSHLSITLTPKES